MKAWFSHLPLVVCSHADTFGLIGLGFEISIWEFCGVFIVMLTALSCSFWNNPQNTLSTVFIGGTFYGAHDSLQIGRHFLSPYISFKQCGLVASWKYCNNQSKFSNRDLQKFLPCRTTETNQPVIIFKAFLCVWTSTERRMNCSNIIPDITVFTVCTFLRNLFPVVFLELSSSLRRSWWSRFLSFRGTNTERGDNWSPWGSFRASTKPHHPLHCMWKHNYACPTHTHAHRHKNPSGSVWPGQTMHDFWKNTHTSIQRRERQCTVNTG